MGASVRPEPAGSKIERNVAALRAQGADEHDVEAYLTQHEGLHPIPSAPRDATASRLGSKPPVTDPGGTAAAVLRGVSQGATFGFADEMASGVDALKDKLTGGSGTYASHLAENRAKLKGSQQAHPLAEVAGELGGAVAGGSALGAGAKLLGLGGKAAVGGSKLGTLAKLTAGGAAAGGLAAAGAADEDRLAAVPRGAAFGAGTVLGLKGLGSAIGATGIPKAVQNMLPRPAQSGSLPGRALGAVGMASSEDLAKADILKQLGRARMTLPELEAKASGALPDEMLLNLGGQPMVERAGGAVATPARGASDIVTALDAQNQRLPKLTREQAGQSLGVQRQNAVQTVEDQAAARSAEADQAFGALRSHYAQPQKIDALDALIGRPSFDKAIGETEAILRESPGGLGKPLLQKVKVNGKQTTVVRPLTFDEATLLKQTHDDVAKMASPMASLESGGVTKTRIGKQKGTHAELLDALKSSFPGDQPAGVPSYEKALSGFADKSKLIDAHALGQNFMKANTDELSALWPNLSEPEREFYRKGAIASVEDAVRGKTDGMNPVRDFRDEIMRDNLRIIAPSTQHAADFEDAVQRIHGMHTARQSITGNSKTASRLAQQEDAAGPGLGAMVDVATNGPSSLLKGAFNNAATRRLRGLSEAQVNALAPLLTASGPDLQAVIAELQRISAKQANQGGRVVRGVGQMAGAASAKP